MSALVNVIRAELFKAIRKRRVYVLAALWWLVLPVLILIVGQVIKVNLADSFADEGGSVAAIIEQIASPIGISRLELMLPSLSGPTFYIIVIALLAALLIGEERSQNMWKTVLVAQPGRLSLLAGKFVVGMILYGVLLLGAFLAGPIFGSVGMLFLDTGYGGDWGALARLYGLQWLFGAAAMAFAFLTVWLLRNIALGLVTVFFLPGLLEGLYSLYRTTVGFQPLNRVNAVFQALRLRQTLEDLPRYFFTRNLYAPSREPLSEVVRTLGGDPGSADMGPLTDLIGASITMPQAAAVMAGYTLLFGAILVWSFLRRDVQ